jgi:2-dehydropantoate 2-reductase
MAQRRSEIDVINGAVPREAARLGLATPVNSTVSALVRAREGRFR